MEIECIKVCLKWDEIKMERDSSVFTLSVLNYINNHVYVWNYIMTTCFYF